MKNKLLLSLLLYTTTAMAQPAQRITGIPDTSFSIAKDYINSKKEFPFIQVVPDSSMPTVKEERNIVYCQVNKKQLHLDAFTPISKTSKTPAVIMVHGGGWRSGDHTQHIPLAQHLAALGYAGFTIEYRLSTDALYPAAMYDIRSAIQWVRKHADKYNIDANKITILGFSAGGLLAALTGTTNGMNQYDSNQCNKPSSSLVNAVIDIDGTMSFVLPGSWESQHPELEGASAWWIGYPFTQRKDLWEAASPFTYAERNIVPFLFLNSSLDRMHVGQKEFIQMMTAKGIYTKAVDFGETPHTFCFYRPWFDTMVNAIDEFLSKVF